MSELVLESPPPIDPQSQAFSRLPVRDRLFLRGCDFDFFQAVCLLARLMPDRTTPGRDGTPADELVRFRAAVSLEFPASAIQQLSHGTPEDPQCEMVVNFMGLAGPSGVLPRHYTEMLLRLQYDGKADERYALRDWFDLFNHRLISLFYRAWAKYRFWVGFNRGDARYPDSDSFTEALSALIGQGMPGLKNRLRVSASGCDESGRPRQVLAEIPDSALLSYGGLLGHRPRCAANLEALLEDYFQLPAVVQQFQGQWLQLEAYSQSRLGTSESYSQLGQNLVVGQRVWDVQGKIRVRLGPLSYRQFIAFFPDRSLSSERKAFFLLSHLVRRYVGVELDFDVQLVLQADEVPEARLDNNPQTGPRLGWNTWLRSEPFGVDAEHAVLAGDEVRWLDDRRTTAGTT